jgi:hypothetical protein
MNMSEAPEFMSATAHAPVRVRLSRTETETLCYKATRGAGYSWGIAEEAANAVGWLCANGIDGTAALAAAIVPPTLNAPDISNDLWVSSDGKPLCPLTTGAALSDFAASVFASNNGHVQLGPVRRPVMLLPFISQCTATTGGSITLEWEGRKLTVGNAIRSDAETLSALISANAATIMLSHCHDVIQADRPNAVAFANPHTLAELDGLALRTTVPASEQSRNSGAGAGTSDND